jgi:hypothetical protein
MIHAKQILTASGGRSVIIAARRDRRHQSRFPTLFHSTTRKFLDSRGGRIERSDVHRTGMNIGGNVISAENFMAMTTQRQEVEVATI